MDEKRALRARVLNSYVETSQGNSVLEAIEYYRDNLEVSEDGVTQDNLFITGASRVGKTSLLKRYCRQEENRPYIKTDDNGNQVMITPVLFVSMPSEMTYTSLYERIITGMGAPLVGKKIEQIKHRVLGLLKDQEVKVLILDEAQSVKSSPFLTSKNAMDSIKDIINISSVSIVASGVANSDDVLRIDDQYDNRFRKITMEPFKECNDDFLSFLKSFEEQINAPFPLRILDDDGARANMIFKATNGLPGKVHDFFVELFYQIGISNKNISLSQMKVTKRDITNATDIIKNHNK